MCGFPLSSSCGSIAAIHVLGPCRKSTNIPLKVLAR
jgi:hypothetical protein